MSANAVLPILAAPTRWERYFDRGVRDRGDLLSNARKVRRDLSLLPSGDPNVPPLIAVLDRLLAEGALWNDRSVGMAEEHGSLTARLPEPVNVPLDVLVRWSDNIKDLSVAVGRLGTFCHFALKDERKKAVAEAQQATPGDYRPLKRRNALLNHLEILLGRTRLSSYPIYLEIEPTNECNLRCRACVHGITKDFPHTELSPTYLDLLDEALPFAENTYLFGRGEATMAVGLSRLIDRAVLYQVRVDLLTNGILVDRLNLPWQSLHRIGISIDGATEETMRNLRPVAPLAHVLGTMKQLRAKAPQAVFYTQVTVSRLNFEEIPALVETLAGAGVNEVVIHSLNVFHEMHEGIQVRDGDRGDMARAVDEASRIAARHGIKLINEMRFDSVARPHDGDRNRPAMFQILKDTPLPVLEIREPAELRSEIESLASQFEYYPPALIEAAGLKPDPVPPRPHFDAARPETIDKAIRELARQAREITPERAAVPYCFVPWKMPLVGADGRARACCHMEGQFADLDQSDSFRDFWSSDGYARLRDSMFRAENLPDACVSCRAHERSMLSTDTLAVADMLDVPISL